MNVIQTPLPGVLIFEPQVFGDDRGFFVEIFRESWFSEAGMETTFIQDNLSRSRQGVLRGLHYQMHKPQGKLVKVSRGRIYDVAVDIRPGSPAFGQWFGCELDDVSHRMLYIPPDFAHGFVVLSPEADFVYKCTQYYDVASECGIAWNDPALDIAWPLDGIAPLVSDKDAHYPAMKDQAPERLPRFFA